MIVHDYRCHLLLLLIDDQIRGGGGRAGEIQPVGRGAKEVPLQHPLARRQGRQSSRRHPNYSTVGDLPGVRQIEPHARRLHHLEKTEVLPRTGLQEDHRLAVFSTDGGAE